MMPKVTTAETVLYIPPNDPSVESVSADDWDAYRRTLDESKLTFDGEPNRIECKGLSVRERCWAHDEASRADGGHMMSALAWCRVGLVAHADKRIPDRGVSVLPDDVVWEIVGHNMSTMFHVGMYIFSEAVVGKELGKESPSPQTEPTETATSED